VPSLILEKVYESPGGNVKTVVLWVSKHSPLRAQLSVLEERFGGVVVYQLSGLIPGAESVVEYAGRIGAGVVVPVLPLSMIARLAELGRHLGFTVLITRMNCIAVTRDMENARRLVNEAPDKRTLAVHADGSIRVLEFEKFEKLVEVKLVTEPL
jgi:hypothetical protein